MSGFKDSLEEETTKMDLWFKEREYAYHEELFEQERNGLQNRALNSYAPHEKPSSGPTGNYMTRSDVENVLEDNIKDGVGPPTSHVIKEIVEGTMNTHSRLDFMRKTKQSKNSHE